MVEPIERMHLLISGRVQGVFFRATAEHVARELGITGWARNLPDGRVEAIAEGDPEALDRFADWCREGPPAARVEGVEIRRSEATGEFQAFEVWSVKIS